MSYIFSFEDARKHDAWMTDDRCRLVLSLEMELVWRLLNPLPKASILDIGCGTGWFSRFFMEKGLDVTGIDPSPFMLDRARALLGNRVSLYEGFGENLPFDDNSFDIACLITSLEFVENPEKVLAEAARVAKDRVLIGCLNRYAIKGLQRRIQGLFTKNVYSHAKFYSLWELRYLMKGILGNVPMKWGSTSHFPISAIEKTINVERSPWLMRSPFGAFVVICAECRPRYRTRPLSLKVKKAGTGKGAVRQQYGKSKNGVPDESPLV